MTIYHSLAYAAREAEKKLTLLKSITVDREKPMTEKTPKENYNAFWKEILEDEAGNINKEQLMKELSDFSFMLREVPKVYMAISGNKLSYPTYHAETVITEFEDYLNEERTQAVKDAIECGEVVSSEKVDSLYDAIAHGDDKHRAWLKEAIEKHFAPAEGEAS
jgi:hypothetical protein